MLRAGDKDFAVAEAVAYRSGASLGKAYQIEGERLCVRCADGVLEMRIHSIKGRALLDP